MGNKVDELYVVIVGSYVLIVLLDAVFMLEKLRVMGNLPMRGLLRRRGFGYFPCFGFLVGRPMRGLLWSWGLPVCTGFTGGFKGFFYYVLGWVPLRSFTL